MDELNKLHPAPAGSEFVMEGATGKSKIWIEPKYGMIMRILMAQPGGAPKVRDHSNDFRRPTGRDVRPRLQGRRPRTYGRR